MPSPNSAARSSAQRGSSLTDWSGLWLTAVQPGPVLIALRMRSRHFSASSWHLSAAVDAGGSSAE